MSVWGKDSAPNRIRGDGAKSVDSFHKESSLIATSSSILRDYNLCNARFSRRFANKLDLHGRFVDSHRAPEKPGMNFFSAEALKFVSLLGEKRVYMYVCVRMCWCFTLTRRHTATAQLG